MFKKYDVLTNGRVICEIQGITGTYYRLMSLINLKTNSPLQRVRLGHNVRKEHINKTMIKYISIENHKLGRFYQ